MAEKEDYLRKKEREQDDRDSQQNRNKADQLILSMKGQEVAILQEALMLVNFDTKNVASQIKEAITGVVKNSEHIKNTEIYRKFSLYKETWEEILSYCVSYLEEKLRGSLSDNEVEIISRSIITFFQEKKQLLRDNKIDPDKTDKDNFIEIANKVASFRDKGESIRNFIEYIWENPDRIEKIRVQIELLKKLEIMPIQLPTQKDISEGEWNELQAIQESWEAIMGGWAFEEFIANFFHDIKEEDVLSITFVE